MSNLGGGLGSLPWFKFYLYHQKNDGVYPTIIIHNSTMIYTEAIHNILANGQVHSSQSIQEQCDSIKRFRNHALIRALQDGVSEGQWIQVDGGYQIPPGTRLPSIRTRTPALRQEMECLANDLGLSSEEVDRCRNRRLMPRIREMETKSQRLPVSDDVSPRPHGHDFTFKVTICIYLLVCMAWLLVPLTVMRE